MALNFMAYYKWWNLKNPYMVIIGQITTSVGTGLRGKTPVCRAPCRNSIILCGWAWCASCQGPETSQGAGVCGRPRQVTICSIPPVECSSGPCCSHSCSTWQYYGDWAVHLWVSPLKGISAEEGALWKRQDHFRLVNSSLYEFVFCSRGTTSSWLSLLPVKVEV